MARGVNYSGLVIAVIGFGLTRFTVTLAIYDDPTRFYLAGVVPLALGLGLAAFGVALTVSAVDRSVVRTTAVWCVIGVSTMLFVAVLTVFGSSDGTTLDLQATLSESYLSNFLIVGSIGGTLTGLYAARSRRQRRQVQHQANTLVVLNRLLRHEVLNAITAIRGYALLEESGSRSAEEVVTEQSDAIVETIDDVNYLTRHSGPHTVERGPVDVRSSLETSVETVQGRYQDTTIDLGDVPEGVVVRADEQLPTVFTHLLENAVVHADDHAPEVTVSPGRSVVRVTISDAGPGLPPAQQRLLEAGAIEEFDNPGTGFGLNLVHLFVMRYGGTVETSVDEAGTSITVALPRVSSAGSGMGPAMDDFTGVGPATPHLLIAAGAAVIAGVSYGVVSEVLGGSIAGIGVFYGTADPIVGWLTHEFHSVVFGLMFVGWLSVFPERHGTGFPVYLGVGVAWGLLLWVGAAGVIAPIWLQLLGIPASLPNLTGRLFAAHLVWGVSLSVLTYLGYRYLLPVVETW